MRWLSPSILKMFIRQLAVVLVVIPIYQPLLVTFLWSLLQPQTYSTIAD